MQRRALCRSRRELSNDYLFTKFGFDTAENEPCQVCPKPEHGVEARPRSSSGTAGPPRDPHAWFLVAYQDVNLPTNFVVLSNCGGLVRGCSEADVVFKEIKVTHL